MIKKEITYTDFNGVDRKEDFYFHLSLPEVTRLEAELGGVSLAEYSKRIAQDQNVPELLAFLEKIILNAYGKKSMDGRSFQKSPEIRKEFEYSQAYANLFEQLLMDTEQARKFGEMVADTGKNKKNQVVPSVVSPTNN